MSVLVWTFLTTYSVIIKRKIIASRMIKFQHTVTYFTRGRNDYQSQRGRVSLWSVICCRFAWWWACVLSLTVYLSNQERVWSLWNNWYFQNMHTNKCIPERLNNNIGLQRQLEIWRLFKRNLAITSNKKTSNVPRHPKKYRCKFW